MRSGDNMADARTRPATCLRAARPLPYDGAMLSLKSTTSERWLRQVAEHLDEILIDHAHCEKKAAGTAMNLLFAYVEDVELGREMTRIVQEELDHFNQVLDQLQRRRIRFRRLKPSNYGAQLHTLIRKFEPGRAIDRLLVAGLIEARSCERFDLLRKHVPDPELSRFFWEPVRVRGRAPQHLCPAGHSFWRRSGGPRAVDRTGRVRGGDHCPGGRIAARAQLTRPLVALRLLYAASWRHDGTVPSGRGAFPQRGAGLRAPAGSLD